ncbi:MAG: ABC transporter ATP-binding protein, partial [Candidatus Omnitrophica bacterium]|nr:ABC transporter ATP-binding protein [Candidatus Omnitrophota bacterium]
GKTSLLRIIGALTPFCQGDVRIDGKSIQEFQFKHPFGFVFQEPNLLPWRSVLENVRLPAEILRENDVMTRVAAMIELVNLNGFEHAYPHELSGGMKTRVAIARALSIHPSIFLMDEPFGSLDEITRDAMNFELLRIWNEIKTTVIFVTHSIAEAVLLSDTVIVLTSRPAMVKEIRPIDLARPRTKQMRRTSQFVKIIEDLRERLLS